jgi:hypothetical protein
MATTTPTGVPRAFVTAGNAERYVMEADTLRRRQLCAAFLHGTARGWRYRRRLWIPALAGVVAVAVTVAVIAVANAFVRQTEINQDERRRHSLNRTAQLGTAGPDLVTALGDTQDHRQSGRLTSYTMDV